MKWWLIVKFFGTAIAVTGPHADNVECARAASAKRAELAQYYSGTRPHYPRGLITLAAGRAITPDVIATDCVSSAEQPALK